MAIKKKEVFSAIVPLGLPYTPDAEQAVIGTILVTPNSILGASEKIVPDYFFDPVHKIIVGSICELIAEHKPPEFTLVYNRLREKGDNLKIGDLEGLRRFLEFNARPEFLDHWLDEVKKYWELRTVIEVCTDIAAKGKNVVGANVSQFLCEAEARFTDISDSRVTTGLLPVSKIIGQTLKEFEALFRKEGQITGVSSGFTDLDHITSGFQKSDLIILAARPAMGKTALALNFAYNAVFHHKKTVAFFSLEMSSSQLMQRMLATASKIDSNKFRNGKMSSADFERLYPEAVKFQTDSLLFDDTPGISLMDLASRCRKAKRERGSLDLVIVDYLQLMSANSPNAKGFSNREREISTISVGLKNLAKELSCPVIALSQLNRGLEMRPDKRPRPADLRECVTGDTLVSLADGRRLPIQDLVNQTPHVLSVTPDWKIVKKQASGVWYVGEKTIFKVKLASGRFIRATGNHRLLTRSGWRQIQQLNKEDHLAIQEISTESENSHLCFSSSQEFTQEYSDILKSDFLNNMGESDLLWDRIVSIEQDGEEKVYDISVPETECWIANGIISHNSGSLEQDADLILFVYRDEVYNKESPDKGIAEIIIGKNRHGPIDTVQLAFQSNYTSFYNLSRQG